MTGYRNDLIVLYYTVCVVVASVALKAFRQLLSQKAISCVVSWLSSRGIGCKCTGLPVISELLPLINLWAVPHHVFKYSRYIEVAQVRVRARFLFHMESHKLYFKGTMCMKNSV